MTERDDAIEEGASALRDLLQVLDMLANCSGNKAKLELAELAAIRYLDLQELCESHQFTIAVGVDVSSEEIIRA